MGIYRQEYGNIIEPLLRRWAKDDGSFHGSFVRDLFLQYVAQGRFITDTQDEGLLRELVNEGVIEVLNRAPTPSKAAFAGLSYSRSGYESGKWPVNALHWWYRWPPAHQ